MIRKWSCPPEKVKNLNKVFTSTVKVPLGPMEEKAGVDVVVIKAQGQ